MHGSLTFIGDATVASRRWLSFNWGQLINSRLDEPSVVRQFSKGEKGGGRRGKKEKEGEAESTASPPSLVFLLFAVGR